MNQNLSYTAYAPDPRGGQSQNQQSFQGLSSFHTAYPNSTYTNSSTAPFHSSSSASFLPSNIAVQQQSQSQHQQQQRNAQQQQQQQQVTMSTRLPPDEKNNLSALLDSYFIDPPTSSSWSSGGGGSSSQSAQVSQLPPQISYNQGNLGIMKTLPSGISSSGKSPDKGEKERVKKARQAEAARMRYHRLTQDEKRELNLKRTLAQKRKRQREKEMEELDSILRETNDIQEDPDITEQLREKRMRAKWAEAARARYARMTAEERRAHNNRRRMRQMQNALAAVKATQAHDFVAGIVADPTKDEEAVRAHIKNQNAKKAEAARQRYHRMTEDEKRMYNQRRTEAFRRRRMEEEMLLAMPIGRINGEALDRAQQIVVRNAKRAEAARARYQRMTPDQRKSYNQKRYTPKRKRADGLDMIGVLPMNNKKEDMDALSSLERDVIKRTQQAQQTLLRQQRQNTQDVAGQQQQQQQNVQGGNGSYILQSAANSAQLTHIPQQNQQVRQMQMNQQGGQQQHQQLVHSVHQIPVQNQPLSSQHIQHQQQNFHQQQGQQSAGHPGHVVHQQQQGGQQMGYPNGMMINGQQHVQSQIVNPYGAPQPRA